MYLPVFLSSNLLICTEYIQICIEYKHLVSVIYCADTAARRPSRITRRHHLLPQQEPQQHVPEEGLVLRHLNQAAA